MNKSCGTCAHWSVKPVFAHTHSCEWTPAGPVPFWMSMYPTQEGGQLTHPAQGAHCPTWVLATRLARG